MILTIFYILAIIGGISMVTSVLMLVFRAIYAGIWCEYGVDNLDTPFWKKYEYTFKVFLTIGVFFIFIAIAWFIIFLVVSAIGAQI